MAAKEEKPKAEPQEAENASGAGLGWFRRMKEGITTKTAEKKEIPEGNWYKCPSCKTVIATRARGAICGCVAIVTTTSASVPLPISTFLFDGGKFRELQAKMVVGQPLEFKDTKDYEDRLTSSMEKTGLKDAIRTGVGEVAGRTMVISCMDFSFIGGSMGSVVGEKIARAIDYAIKNGLPFVCITKSGGARMMEAGFSLMQMAKTSAKLSLLSQGGAALHLYFDGPHNRWRHRFFCHARRPPFGRAQCPHWLCRTHGWSKRPLERTCHAGFQRAEFLLEHGFVDRIVHRSKLQGELSALVSMLTD